jgi:hypothetical protein
MAFLRLSYPAGTLGYSRKNPGLAKNGKLNAADRGSSCLGRTL